MAKGLDNQQKSVIDGLLLSDGHLDCPCKSARMTFSLKYRGFAKAIIRNISSLKWSPIKTYEYFDDRTNKTYTQISLRSKVDDYLTQQYDRWYVDRHKIVPLDLEILPITMLWWYLGDGNLGRKKSRPNFRRVCLSTDSFSGEELEILQHKLKTILGGTSVYSESGRIMIGRDALCSLSRMLDGNNPVPEYDYKFDFGQYLDKDYLKKSYANRPLAKINTYRKENNVREFDLNLLEV